MAEDKYFGAPNDFRNYIQHYGVKGMKWRRHTARNNDDDNRNDNNGDTIAGRAVDQLNNVLAGSHRHHIGQTIANGARNLVNRQIEHDRQEEFKNSARRTRNRMAAHKITRTLTEMGSRQERDRNQEASLDAARGLRNHFVARRIGRQLNDAASQEARNRQKRKRHKNS